MSIICNIKVKFVAYRHGMKMEITQDKTGSGSKTGIARLLHGRRIPSLAFIVVMVIGGFFFLFSLAELIGGIVSRPLAWISIVGGLFQMLVFAYPFFIVAWLLWFRPKIGASVLICLGLAMGIWMILGWRRPEDLDDWIVPSLLSLIPLILGAFTLFREFKTSKVSAVQIPKTGRED